MKHICYLFLFVALLVFGPRLQAQDAGSAAPATQQNKQAPLSKRAQYKKGRAEWKEQRRLERENKAKIKEHDKRIQTKKTRKQMRETRRKANLVNGNKREFFLIRWFKKKK